ncbi:MAG: hypothetical protein OXE55_07130 [Flavobacteriaceae bacterium]|nr:hypothetical protein [Flavobacteriaceae bacterium]
MDDDREVLWYDVLKSVKLETSGPNIRWLDGIARKVLGHTVGSWL